MRAGYWADVVEAVEFVRGLRVARFQHLYDMSERERAGDEVLRHATAWLLSNRRRDESITPPTRYRAERYDYEKQAWIGTDGRWLSCSHPQEMFCQCYGRAHAGELAGLPVQADIALPSPTCAEVSEARVAQESADDKLAGSVAVLCPACGKQIAPEDWDKPCPGMYWYGRHAVTTLTPQAVWKEQWEVQAHDTVLSKQAVAARWQGIREQIAALEPTPATLEERLNQRMQQLGAAVEHAVPTLSSPTINEWPEHERRGYDTYQRELAALEWTLEQERQGRYGAQPSLPPKPQLDEAELAQTWGEWIETTRAETCTRCGLAESEHGGLDGWCPDVDDESGFSTRWHFEQAWDEEVDEIYAAEELERAERAEDERRSDR